MFKDNIKTTVKLKTPFLLQGFEVDTLEIVEDYYSFNVFAMGLNLMVYSEVVESKLKFLVTKDLVLTEDKSRFFLPDYEVVEEVEVGVGFTGPSGQLTMCLAYLNNNRDKADALKELYIHYFDPIYQDGELSVVLPECTQGLRRGLVELEGVDPTPYLELFKIPFPEDK